MEASCLIPLYFTALLLCIITFLYVIYLWNFAMSFLALSIYVVSNYVFALMLILSFEECIINLVQNFFVSIERVLFFPVKYVLDLLLHLMDCKRLV